jgi:hypothetical protein
VATDRVANEGEVRVPRDRDILCVKAFCERGESDEVAEQDRHDPALDGCPSLAHGVSPYHRELLPRSAVGHNARACTRAGCVVR